MALPDSLICVLYVKYLDLLQRFAVDTKHAPTVLKSNRYVILFALDCTIYKGGRLGSRVDSVLDSGAEGPEFKSQPRRCRVTVLGKLFTPVVPLFAKQQNW